MKIKLKMPVKLKKERKKPKKLTTIPKRIRTVSILMFIFVLLTFNVVSTAMTGIEIYKRSTIQVDTELNGLKTSIEKTFMEYINQLLIFNNDSRLAKLLQNSTSNLQSGEQATSQSYQTYQQLLSSLAEQDSNIMDYYLINTDGIITFSLSDEMVGQNVSEQTYVSRIMNGEAYVVDNVSYQEYLGSHAFLVSSPITQYNKVVGVAVTVLSSATFDEMIALINTMNISYYITDNADTIVYSDDKSEIGMPFEVLEKEANITPTSGPLADPNVFQMSLDGDSYFMKQLQSEKLGWTIMNLTSFQSLSESAMTQNIILIIFMILSCTFATLITSALFKPFTNVLKEISQTTIAIANGDFTSRVSEDRNSVEFRDLALHVNLMAEQLSSIIQTTSKTITQVEDSSTSLCTVSEEVHASATELTQKMNFITEKATEQNELSSNSSTQVTELGTEIENLYAKNKEMIQHSELMNDVLQENNEMIQVLTTESEKAMESSKDVSEQVELLTDQFKKVAEIISIIENISSQTNLLSLNASIEAARAGEAGRGFAVVANEIRSLSDEVQNSVNNISDIIKTVESITTDTKSAADQSDRIVSEQVISYKEMQKKFSTMADSIVNMKHLSDDISDYVIAVSSKKDIVLQLMKDMTNGSLEIENITRQASESVEDQTMAFEEVNINAEELIVHAQEAKDVISKCTIE